MARQREVPWCGWCSYRSQCLAWCQSHFPPQSCQCLTGMAVYHQRRTFACQDWSLTHLKQRRLFCLPRMRRTRGTHLSLQKAQCWLILGHVMLVKANSLPTTHVLSILPQWTSDFPCLLFLYLNHLFLGLNTKYKGICSINSLDAKIICLYFMFHILKHEHKYINIHMHELMYSIYHMYIYVSTHISSSYTFLMDKVFVHWIPPHAVSVII